MAGSHFLKHTYKLSGEKVVHRWVENPNKQLFIGAEVFQPKLPINPSQMIKW